MSALGFSAIHADLLAQCSAPTSAETVIDNATCLSNGKITISTTSGGEGTTLQYALYNAANTAEIKGYQTSNKITDVMPRHVRYACETGFSDPLTMPVTVSGSYTTPTISSFDYHRMD